MIKSIALNKTSFINNVFVMVLKQITFRIFVSFLSFFTILLLVDFMNNYPNAKGIGYGFFEFLFFETVLAINIISDLLSFIVCIGFIWFFLSISFSGQTKIFLTFGLNPYKILLPCIITIIFLICFYLFILKSAFVNIANDAEFIIMDLKGRKKQTTFSKNITIVKKNQSTKDTIILYLNNPYYKKNNKQDFNEDSPLDEYKIYVNKISIITYNQNNGVKNWQTFDVHEITQNKNDKRSINIKLKNPKIEDILLLQNSQLDIIVDNDGIYRILFDCNINILTNQIDIEGGNVFVFPFTSLPIKIANLKLQNLSYYVFEYQFYSTIKNAMIFILALVIPMYFLFNINARSFEILRIILASIASFLFCFVFCHLLSGQALLLKNGFLIMMLNIFPCSIFICLFLFLNLKRHC